MKTTLPVFEQVRVSRIREGDARYAVKVLHRGRWLCALGYTIQDALNAITGYIYTEQG